MNIVLSDPKTGKAYSKKLEEASAFFNKRIGEIVKLESGGLPGFEAKIVGGSDFTGTPMRGDVVGTSRKAIFTTRGVGLRSNRKGLKKRVRVRGNTASKETNQLNLVFTKMGTANLEEIFPKKEKAAEAETGEKKPESKKKKQK